MEIPHLTNTPPSPRIRVSDTSDLQISTDVPSSTISTAWDWGALLDLSIEDDPFVFSWDSGNQTAADSFPTTDNQKSDVSDPSDRVRKRDPRMSCSNYLAGRIPCSCPELDEKEDEEVDEVVGRKRARTTAATARCQVPGCEADIKELKGYHRRHRVCLRCAYATSVVLDGQQKRYCQQCGKFHILPDFDEGKRSCRRKLERHNKRRRRKSIDFKSAVEKEVQGALSAEDVSCDREAGRELLDGVAREGDSLCLSNQIIETDTLLDSEDGHGSPFRSFPSFQNIQTTSCVASGETQIEGGKDNSKSGHSSSFCGNKSTYSSVCPTDRISFKLYDWNPAEFPRRLRHQIFQWLASMPVELEGYIRPGCTILTVFIAMPHLMWVKLSEDVTLYISDLVNSPESLFSERGTMYIYLNNMIFQVLKDGTSLININLEVRVPKLHYVHPPFFEAGQPMEFIACGSNLLQPKFRFLVSFAGKYLAYDSCLVIPHGKARSCQAVEGDSTNSSDHELFKICIPHTESKLFGPAFIEVENESGLSNFIPVLFGSKQVCSELQVMWECIDGSLCSKGTVSHLTVIDAVSDPCEVLVSKQTAISELLLDIAWLLKQPQLDNKETPLTSTKILRFNCILNFLIQNKSISVLEKILESLKAVMDAEELNNPVNITYAADMKLLLEYMNHANEILNQRFQHTKGLVMHSGNTVLKGVPSSNHDLDTTKEDGFEPTVTSTSQEGSGNVTLLKKDIIMNVNLSPHPIQGFKWPQKACSNVFSGTITSSRRLLVLVMATLAVCFAMCISLSHPHKVREFAITVRRCLFGAPEVLQDS